MKKDKKKKRKSKSKIKDNKVLTLDKIEESVLTQAIVESYRIIQKEKKEEAVALKNEQQREWYEIIGQKIYDNEESRIKKKVHELRNSVVAFWKLLFMRSDEVRDPRATFALISMSIISTFSLCKWGLYFGAAFVLALAFKGTINPMSGIVGALFIWIFARIFRVAGYEVEKLKDGNLLIAIFSGILSFVAVILAILALVWK